ncbi:hypothetical protein ACFX13_019556 [Malus domestica]
MQKSDVGPGGRAEDLVEVMAAGAVGFGVDEGFGVRVEKGGGQEGGDGYGVGTLMGGDYDKAKIWKDEFQRTDSKAPEVKVLKDESGDSAVAAIVSLQVRAESVREDDK